MNILITGGAGFIGANYCHYIYNEADNIVCLDALTYAADIGYLGDLVNKPNFKFVKGNICDEKLVNDLFEKENFDTVVNFAAESHVENSIFNPQIFIDSNITGVRVLLDACKKYKVGKFHQVSTDEVYGELKKGDSAFTEASAYRPTSPYSITKAAADLLVLSYHSMFGLNVTISRCSNNYGIYQHPEKFIPKMISQILKGDNITVHGDGSNVRDWINVLDHCQGIHKIVKDGRAGCVYNLGSNNEMSNKDLATLILSYFPESKSKIIYVDNRLNNDYRYAINYEKAKKELSYHPEHTFASSLPDIIKWYKEK